MSGSVSEAVRRFDSCHAAMLTALDGVRDDEDLARSTPCPEWDLRRLVEHVSDVAHVLARLARTGVLSLDPPPDAEPGAGDPVARARSQLRRAASAIQEAAGSADERVRGQAMAAAQSGAVELAAHGWDVTTAMGRAPALTDPEAASVLQLAGGLLDDAQRGSNFAPARAATGAATVADSLAAFLGRRARA
ncbi:maleylpyruvate isomerase family mycothiol-dependent enzyme [uncultured Phycicoccus sp.]|uniref:maleylpyruvate isomerase family mycothiol-dependent enzyme n=1 Tax=uncultured Phycicoccus sp. TaxID=661422 RepID=UPI002618343B|nr:maleylpyruvate isomerase family mycothiol-dependent enzyme [uncultured Phycicoccus sp.]